MRGYCGVRVACMTPANTAITFTGTREDGSSFDPFEEQQRAARGRTTRPTLGRAVRYAAIQRPPQDAMEPRRVYYFAPLPPPPTHLREARQVPAARAHREDATIPLLGGYPEAPGAPRFRRWVCCLWDAIRRYIRLLLQPSMRWPHWPTAR